MKRLASLFAQVACVLGLSGEALAQTSDGYIGIYSDSQGTTPCVSVPPLTGATLYVIAKTSGMTANGITGAEFRIEVTDPEGWSFSYSKPSGATGPGDPIDTSSSPEDDSGVNLAFSSCVLPQSGQIPLGTIGVFNASGSMTRLLVKRHNQPTNVGFFCPLFTLCNEPILSSWCMTPATEPPCSLGTAKLNLTSSADDPVVFEAQLQGASSDGGGEPLPDPERVVLAMFKVGIIGLPAGETSATLASTTINSEEIQQTLESYGVETIGKAFPAFDLADTVATTSSGQVVRVANLSEIYRLTLPELGDPQGLADALTPLMDVLYAHRDGTFEMADVCSYPLCNYTVLNCPNDLRFMEQWALVNGGQAGGICEADIDADKAWDTLRELGGQPGNLSTKIAIHDWGIDAGHEDMMAKDLWRLRLVRSPWHVRGWDRGGEHGQRQGHRWCGLERQAPLGSHRQ